MVAVKPMLELLFLVLQFEGVDQAAVEGNGDGPIPEIESVAVFFAVVLLLVDAEFGIERVEATLDAAPREVAALGDEVVGQPE